MAVFKKYNLRRHYESRHKDKYDSLQGQMRADKLSKLQSGLLAQQNTFVRQTQLNQSSVRASFRAAQLIASRGKPFTDGEFVKKCLNAVAEEVCPEKKDVFNDRVHSHPACRRSGYFFYPTGRMNFISLLHYLPVILHAGDRLSVRRIWAAASATYQWAGLLFEVLA